ncbi:DNA repair protein RadA [Candidatus Roizmanbacteria bacterium RIFCSPLOWO2_02_FULL_41_9]|uniref:DNA repair protein RadA n=1 Tax=Candidatus Roizmanbacteria bacterium RIFCSPLOWO2_02_FULL_41_9 TaxID=1802077 RepID=A0A1F7JRM6_9BACT|nr:MAG: DNA repair protein RadA [Candidatus Roizmanbacteria bacterium RIFCSPLOWO2_02_FULL_41_9]
MGFYICSNCGYGSASWIGKCPDCNQWNSLVLQRDEKDKRKEKTQKLTFKPLTEVPSLVKGRLQTGLFEFDRVLGGGFVSGEIVLLTGEPGVGKSTLILQSLSNLKTLYISGEEAAEQVKDRAERLNIQLENFFFSDTLQVEGIIECAREIREKIDVIVIDSVQTVYSKEVEGQPGSITQLKETAAKLIRFAKENKIPIIVIGHVTKDGDIAGPKTLEHMVDAVINFEGERVSHFRVLRAQKNRFGSTDEIGIFEMAGRGLREVNDPLAFLEDTTGHVPGKAIVGSMEGRRPLFFEIQVLASPSILTMPRRVVKGVDYSKVLLLLAVIRKHLNLPLHSYDIYVNVVGGVEIKSPAADLGIVASLISSIKNLPLPPKSIFVGEVGLLGEVRQVYGEKKIVSEAKRLALPQVFSSETVKSLKELQKQLGEKGKKAIATPKGIVFSE